MTPQRILSIDLLRGFALIFMVLIHFMVYFGNQEAVHTWLYFVLNHGMGDWGAGAFLMMMGMSQALSDQKHKDLTQRGLFRRIVTRGVFLFLAGLLLQALARGPEDLWRWDILPLMGFATVVLFGCRFLPSWSILASVAAVLLCTPWLRAGLDPQAVWGVEFVQVPLISDYLPGLFIDPAREFIVIWQAHAIAQGFFLTGEFPVLPWLLFPLVGFVMGRHIAGGTLHRDVPWLLTAGIMLVGLGVSLGYAGMSRPPTSIIDGFIAPLSFYPDSFSMACAQLGMALSVFSILFYLCDVRRCDKLEDSWAVRIFKRTSRFSLTFYFLHYLLIGWPLALTLALTGRPRVADFMGAVPAVICGIIAVILLEILLGWWESRGAKYSLEWFLAGLTR